MKKIISIFSLLLLIPICGYGKNITGDHWPSLFYPQEDLTLQNKKKYKNKSLKERVYRSYYFVSDFLSSTKGHLPYNWIDGKKSPSRALLLGFPQPVLRPKEVRHNPVYVLPKLSYFKGDGLFINRVNSCLLYWSEQKFKTTFHCFNHMRIEEEKKKLVFSRLEKTVFQAVFSFYLLDFISHNWKIISSKYHDYLLKNQLYPSQHPDSKEYLLKLAEIEGKILDQKTLKRETQGVDVPPTNFEIPYEEKYFDRKEAYGLMRPLMTTAALKLEESEILPKKVLTLDRKFYEKALTHPIYFEKSRVVETSRIHTKIQGDSQDPKTWLQNILPLIYLNTMAINNYLILWDRAVFAANKLEKYLPLVKLKVAQNGRSPFVAKSPHPHVSNELFLTPHTISDFKKYIHLFRAGSYILIRDPNSALRESVRGIDIPGSDEFNSLLFEQIANVYFDMGMLRLARRTYSWSEIVSKKYVLKSPSALFFGAESAFWNGQYAIAKKAFGRFLFLAGDSEYSPYAYLRIAQIQELTHKDDDALVSYEKILRLFPQHNAAKESQVKIFCRTQASLPLHVRNIEYGKVLSKIQNASIELKQQAKACLLTSDLVKLQQKSRDTKRTEVLEQAKLQEKKFREFEFQFPESDYLKLFEKRMAELKLAKGIFLSEQRECEELLAYYKENFKKLNKLTKTKNRYVWHLHWSALDNRRVLRCSYLLEDQKTISRIEKYFHENENSQKIKTYFRLLKIKSAQNMLNAFQIIKRGLSEWHLVIKAMHLKKHLIVDDDNFWNIILLKKFLSAYYEASPVTRTVASRGLLQQILQKPDKIFEKNLYCHWMLDGFPALPRNLQQHFITKIPFAKWNKFLKESHKECSYQVAQLALQIAWNHPNVNVDRHLIIPYLESQQNQRSDMQWLSFAQTRENLYVNDKNILINIFQKLWKNSSDSSIQKIAKMKLEQFGVNPDRLLWSARNVGSP